MTTINKLCRKKGVICFILGLVFFISLMLSPTQKVSASAQKNETDKTINKSDDTDELSEALKDELAIAAEKIAKGITDMALKDYGKKASGMLGAFSKKYSKAKEDKKAQASKSQASSNISITITGNSDKGSSDYKKSDVLSYKYNSKMDIDVTDKEYEILCRIVEAEAGDQDVYGRILVANVVLNRVNYTKEFANDIEGVVFEKNQFSPISNGAYYSVKVDDITKEAVERATSGEDYSDGALYFIWRSGASKTGAAYFDTLNFLFRYGCHEFYKY